MYSRIMCFLFTARQRSCGKVMFYICLSVILFTGSRGVVVRMMSLPVWPRTKGRGRGHVCKRGFACERGRRSACEGEGVGRHSHGTDIWWRLPNCAVRILLEWILVTDRIRSMGESYVFTSICLSTGVWPGVCGRGVWTGVWLQTPPTPQDKSPASYWSAFLLLPNLLVWNKYS